MNDKENSLEPAREQRDEAAQEEARLIRQAQDGDQRAFEALVRLHERLVFGIIGSFLRRRQDVEDLAQEVFLKAYLAIGRFRPGAPFAPWLHRIAVNTCYDHLRGIRRRPEIGIADLAESEADFLDRYVEKGSPSAGGETADRLAARDLAERILATLPPKDRLVITLREVQGFEIAEIATALGCSRPAAKVRLFRARRAMQAALGRLIRQEEQKARLGRREEDDLP
jgi:RNA polymerase sigma-70 factor (ECF subfamily)